MPRSPNPVPQYFDAENKILSGGLMFYFEAGTTTIKTTFSDVDETIPNPHPVVLDAEGRLPNVLFTGTARQVLQDSDLVQIWERDDVGAGVQINDFNAWDSNISYDAGDIVKFNGMFYESLQNSNQNNQPDLNADFWKEIRFIGVWNFNITYSTGDIVQTTDGSLWKSEINSNLNNDPLTPDLTKWTIAISEANLGDVTAVSVTATDIDSDNLRRDSSNAYTRADIVGTVSETAGVPTGAVIERGSNSDGQYTAFADGTLLMWRDVPILVTGTPTGWTFPYTTNTPLNVTVTTSLVGFTLGGAINISGTTGSTSHNFNVFDVAGSPITGNSVVLTAIGRWF